MVDDPQPQKIPLIFYRTEAGSAPVRQWLKGLPDEDLTLARKRQKELEL